MLSSPSLSAIGRQHVDHHRHDVRDHNNVSLLNRSVQFLMTYILPLLTIVLLFPLIMSLLRASTCTSEDCCNSSFLRYWSLGHSSYTILFSISLIFLYHSKPILAYQYIQLFILLTFLSINILSMLPLILIIIMSPLDCYFSSYILEKKLLYFQIPIWCCIEMINLLFIIYYCKILLTQVETNNHVNQRINHRNQQKQLLKNKWNNLKTVYIACEDINCSQCEIYKNNQKKSSKNNNQQNNKTNINYEKQHQILNKSFLKQTTQQYITNDKNDTLDETLEKLEQIEILQKKLDKLREKHKTFKSYHNQQLSNIFEETTPSNNQNQHNLFSIDEEFENNIEQAIIEPITSLTRNSLQNYSLISKEKCECSIQYDQINKNEIIKHQHAVHGAHIENSLKNEHSVIDNELSEIKIDCDCNNTLKPSNSTSSICSLNNTSNNSTTHSINTRKQLNHINSTQIEQHVNNQTINSSNSLFSQVQTSVTKQSIKPNLNDPTCSICLEDWQPHEWLKLLPCSHLFHSKCLYLWLSRNDSCPLDRSKIFQNM